MRARIASSEETSGGVRTMHRLPRSRGRLRQAVGRRTRIRGPAREVAVPSTIFWYLADDDPPRFMFPSERVGVPGAKHSADRNCIPSPIQWTEMDSHSNPNGRRIQQKHRVAQTRGSEMEKDTYRTCEQVAARKSKRPAERGENVESHPPTTREAKRDRGKHSPEDIPNVSGRKS